MSAERFKSLFQVLKDTFNRSMNDNVFKLSASLAYYTIFSLPPLVILVFSLFGWIFGEKALQGEVFDQINALVGDKLALKIQNIIQSITLSPEFNFATSVGIATLTLGATGIFAEIQDSLNQIWCIKARYKRGWLKIIISRVRSFVIVVSIGLMLIASLLLNALLLALSGKLGLFFPDLSIKIALVCNYMITFAVMTILFAVIFKVLPDAHIRWRDVMVGAFVTAVLFILGKFGIGFYLGKVSFNSIFSTVESGILILVWIYYSAIILYLGAEFTHVYAERYGKSIVPNDYAVLIRHVEIEKKVL